MPLPPAGPRDVVVTEHGYGLGPPTGVLVLDYRNPGGPVELPEVRDDFRHQLFWAPGDWLAVRRGGQVSFAGPGQGVWVPVGCSAEVRGGAGAGVRAVHLRQRPAHAPAHQVSVVGLDESARAAVTVLAAGAPEAAAPSLRERVMGGLAPLAAVPHAGTQDGLAQRVVSALMTDPADTTELSQWALRLHVSTRTLQREFARDLGTTWSAWRTRHRLEASVPLLDLHPVTTVAHLVGYATASAYVAAFRRHFGTTPGRMAAGADAPSAPVARSA